MCSVVGVLIRNPKQKHFDLIRKVFLESRIRGLHATGMSILLNNKIMTFKEPVPANKFIHLDNLEEMVNEDGNLYLIGHCRYSTSDLEYNQPIYNETCSIVHNGVITQELPERWNALFGVACSTKNDSELVLHSKSPLEEFPHSSIATCELHIDRKLRVYRNGKRPLYLTEIGKEGIIITSTKDIAKRSGLSNTNIIPLNAYLTINDRCELTIENISNESNKDLQRIDYGTLRIQ